MSDTPRTLRARGGAGPPVTGIALASRHPFSPRYDLDRTTGRISRSEHDLAGHSIVDKILVLPAPKGGVAAGWALYTLQAQGIAPRALVFTKVNPVFVQGAVHAGIPILHGFENDPVDSVYSGDLVRVDTQTAALIVVEDTGEEKLL